MNDYEEYLNLLGVDKNAICHIHPADVYDLIELYDQIPYAEIFAKIDMTNERKLERLIGRRVKLDTFVERGTYEFFTDH